MDYGSDSGGDYQPTGFLCDETLVEDLGKGVRNLMGKDAEADVQAEAAPETEPEASSSSSEGDDDDSEGQEDEEEAVREEAAFVAPSAKTQTPTIDALVKWDDEDESSEASLRAGAALPTATAAAKPAAASLEEVVEVAPLLANRLISVGGAFRFSPASRSNENAAVRSAHRVPTLAAQAPAPASGAVVPTAAALPSFAHHENVWSSGGFLKTKRNDLASLDATIISTITCSNNRAKAAASVFTAAMTALHLNSTFNGLPPLLSALQLSEASARTKPDEMLASHLRVALEGGDRVPHLDTHGGRFASAPLQRIALVSASLYAQHQPSDRAWIDAMVKASKQFSHTMGQHTLAGESENMAAEAARVDQIIAESRVMTRSERLALLCGDKL